MAINPAMLAQIFLPLIQKAVAKHPGTVGVPSYSLQDDIVNNNLDPYLMLESAKTDGMQGYQDEFLQLNKTAPSKLMTGPDAHSESLIPQKVIDLPDNKLQGLYDEAQKNVWGNSPATALQSAVSMLRQNPKIGLPNDPMMLPYEDPMTGFTSNYNTAMAIPTVSSITDGSPYGLDNIVNDDNPDDELAILAKKLIRGR